MEQAQFEGSELSSGEGASASAPTPPASATTVRGLESNESRRILPTRRKLSAEQEGEVTRLYADTTMAVWDIARKFGIGESSVYRVAQRHGAALRGRQPPAAAQPAKPATGRARPGVRAAASAAKPPETSSTPAAAGAPARGRPRGAGARAATPTAALAHAQRGRSGARGRLRERDATVGRFRVRFLMERVVQARDIRDALRKAESFDAIEVTAVMQED